MASYAHVIANSQTFYDDQDQYDMKLINFTDPNSTHRFVGVGAVAISFGKGHRLGASAHKAVNTSQYWYDTTGFARPPAFTRRSNPLHYDNLRGPSVNNLDALLSKRFAFHERTVEF